MLNYLLICSQSSVVDKFVLRRTGLQCVQKYFRKKKYVLNLFKKLKSNNNNAPKYRLDSKNRLVFETREDKQPKMRDLLYA